MTVKFYVKRDSAEEMTWASVEAEICDDKLYYGSNFLAALKRAVRKWIENTKEGKEAWEHLSHDINIGDLDGYQSRVLGDSLAEEGIAWMKVDIHSQEEFEKDWMFDTVLGVED